MEQRQTKPSEKGYVAEVKKDPLTEAVEVFVGELDTIEDKMLQIRKHLANQEIDHAINLATWVTKHVRGLRNTLSAFTKDSSG